MVENMGTAWKWHFFYDFCSGIRCECRIYEICKKCRMCGSCQGNRQLR